VRKYSPSAAAALSIACALTSFVAALNSAGFAMANSRTGMAVTFAVAAAAALAGLGLGVYGFHGKDRPLRLTTAALGLLGSAAAGMLTLVLALFYRW
jgi:hypothetical protein